jgi:hypothetical protein
MLFPSLIVICPETLPAIVGLKTTPIAQLAPPASVPLTVPPACGQVVFALVSRENGPVNPTEVKEIELACRFVIVNSFVGLVPPTLVAPNAKNAALSVSGATPFPDIESDCGLFVALVVNVRVPAGAAPSAPGVSETRRLHVLPAGTVPGFGHGAVGAGTSAYPAPDTEMESIVRGTACVFVSETACATLATPTAWLPNVTDAGNTVVWATAESAEYKQKITVSDNKTAL